MLCDNCIYAKYINDDTLECTNSCSDHQFVDYDVIECVMYNTCDEDYTPSEDYSTFSLFGE